MVGLKRGEWTAKDVKNIGVVHRLSTEYHYTPTQIKSMMRLSDKDMKRYMSVITFRESYAN